MVGGRVLVRAESRSYQQWYITACELGVLPRYST